MYALAHNVSLPVPSRSRRRPRRHRAVVGSGLVAMMLASVGITAFPTTSFAAPRKLGPTVETRTGDLRSVGTSLVFVANYDASTVTAYPLTGTGSAPPVLTLSGVNVAGPQGIAIDSAGNLWVANNGSVVEYPKSQLAKSLPSPGTVIKGGGTYAGIAFDSSGDLWVDGYGNDSVDEYAKSALAKSTSSAPEVILSGGDVSRPFGLAFDRSGDLWVGSEGNNRVLEYTKA
ncbi:MAG TPA: hypothetical protein VK425_08730, partial [Acidimicrobiales bacterium]|nr:hypothetical protein [Acidimicrobiales bacterium]